jgi:hypothetical protein
MSILNFNDSEAKPARNLKKIKLVFAVGVLAGAIGIGSTLAANINLNDGGNVEFGQGVAQTTACDDSVILTPQSTFVNSEENAEFLFTSLSVTDISSNCNGITFTIKAYKNGQNDPLDLYRAGGEFGTTYNEVKVIDENGNFSFVDGGLLSDDIQDLSSSGFNVDLVTIEVPAVALASAQDVDRITIESSGVAPGLTNWSDVTWAGSDSSGPALYADGLMNGKPSWLEDTNIGDQDFNYGFTSDGMRIMGDANDYGYPYVTNFDIDSTKKVTVQFHFYYNDYCSDHGVIIFPTSYTPEFWWSNNPTGLFGSWNCGEPHIGGITSEFRSDNRVLSEGMAYIGVLIYDPNLNYNNLTLITKSLEGSIINQVSISQTLPPGSNYKIGFSADSDGHMGNNTHTNSYFKNLSILIE